MSNLLLPQMTKRTKRSGLIINSSASALKWFPYGAIYAATKAFVTSFTKGLAKELKNSNTEVQCLMPGAVATNISGHWGQKIIGTPCSKVIATSFNDLGRSKSDVVHIGTLFDECFAYGCIGWFGNAFPPIWNYFAG